MFVQRKSIALCIILSIITCGIYSLYWIFSLTEDTNKVSNRENATGGGLVLLFTIITCGIYQLYWLYKCGDVLDQMRMAQGRPGGHLGIVYLLLGVFGFSIISFALMQSELNEYAG